MKTCAYCGCENFSEAEKCGGCGTSFSSERKGEFGAGFGEWFNQPISLRSKGYLWCAAWGGVVFATLTTKPEYVLAAPAFPLGLVAFLPHGESKAVVAWMLGLPVFLGWAIYALLSAAISRVSKRGMFLL